jgi:dephospho-CoA kinase
VVEIPLLFEKNLEKHFDCTVCIWSGLDVKTFRLKGRMLDETAIRERLNAQMSQDIKALRSDFLIMNNGTLDFLQVQVDRLLQSMKFRG